MRSDDVGFGALLADLAAGPPGRGGMVVLGSGAVPLLRASDAAALVRVAAMAGRHALTNNRFSSDVCAISEARTLGRLPSLRGDNALPRWLAEQAGYHVDELPARQRLALDLDSPQDIAILAAGRDGPATVRRLAVASGISVPRLEDLRHVAADPGAELLVSGRTGSRTLAWLEAHARCRIRFLSEERGLRSGAARAWLGRGAGRAPRSVLGRLLEARGPSALGSVVAELADGAVIDTRVLLADRLGADEKAWPSSEDRFASDLLRAGQVRDAWLAELTAAAASRAPVLLGGHTLVGPGLVRLLGSEAGRSDMGETGAGRSPRAW